MKFILRIIQLAAVLLSGAVHAEVITVEISAQIDRLAQENEGLLTPVSINTYAIGDLVTARVTYDLSVDYGNDRGGIHSYSLIGLEVAVAGDHAASASGYAHFSMTNFNSGQGPADQVNFEWTTRCCNPGALSGPSIYAGAPYNDDKPLRQVSIFLWDFTADLLDSTDIIDLSTLDLSRIGSHGHDRKKIRMFYGTDSNDTVQIQAEINSIARVSTIPIPPAIWLFGSALVGLGWVRRKQAA